MEPIHVQRVRASLVLSAVATALTMPGMAQSTLTQRVSVDARGASGPAGTSSVRASSSADGRYVAFASEVPLDPLDTNALLDVYVHDRVTGATILASRTPSGAGGNAASTAPNLSADGRYVAFQSQATDLVSNDADDTTDDVFVFDRVTGVVTLEGVTVAGGVCNDSCTSPRISADGRFVLFDTAASNVVTGDANGFRDVFLRDRQAATTTRISVTPSGGEANGDSWTCDLSDDGHVSAFESDATNLVASDTNGDRDVFVHDHGTGSTALVSVSTAGVPAAGRSSAASVSADGSRVAFWSAANNLIAGDTNLFSDVFVRDRSAGTTVLVDRIAGSGAIPTLWALTPTSLSADGTRVAFVTQASLDGILDGNTLADVYVRDLAANQTILISRRNPSSFFPAQGGANPAISPDGWHVAFESSAVFDPADTNGAADVLVRDLGNVITTIGTYGVGGVTSSGCQATLHAIGTPSATASAGFTVTATSVEGGSIGMLFYGVTGPRDTPFGITSSTLYVRAPHQRGPVQSAGGTPGACDGQLSCDWNAFMAAGSSAIGQPFQGGETVWMQAWFRDALAPGGSNLSDALWFTVGP